SLFRPTRSTPCRPRRVGSFIYLAPDGGVPGLIDCGYHRGVLNLLISAHRKPTRLGVDLDTGHTRELRYCLANRRLTPATTHTRYYIFTSALHLAPSDLLVLSLILHRHSIPLYGIFQWMDSFDS